MKDLQSEIERIEKVYNKLINVIVDWEQKLKEIKNNLESGINILKKTVFNFNKNFISKSYYNNIISIQSKKNEDCIFL